MTMTAFGALPKPNLINDAWNMLNLGSWGKYIPEEMQPRNTPFGCESESLHCNWPRPRGNLQYIEEF